jgi:hypothetical protein
MRAYGSKRRIDSKADSRSAKQFSLTLGQTSAAIFTIRTFRSTIRRLNATFGGGARDLP